MKESLGRLLTAGLLVAATSGCGAGPSRIDAGQPSGQPEQTSSQNYTKLTLVFDGENYYSLGQACGVNPQDLINANGNKDLHAGGTVVVPESSNCRSVEEIHQIMRKECTVSSVTPDFDDTVYSISQANNSVPALTVLASGLQDSRSVVQGTTVFVAPGCDIRREK